MSFVGALPCLKMDAEQPGFVPLFWQEDERGWADGWVQGLAQAMQDWEVLIIL